tara:strand:- start:2133 stop:2297 length:165 start_codon:yes stop_codon:yes gene_type:complete
MREDGKRPLILKRRGVLEEKACPVGFRVEVSFLMLAKYSRSNTNTTPSQVPRAV